MGNLQPTLRNVSQRLSINKYQMIREERFTRNNKNNINFKFIHLNTSSINAHIQLDNNQPCHHPHQHKRPWINQRHDNHFMKRSRLKHRILSNNINKLVYKNKGNEDLPNNILISRTLMNIKLSGALDKSKKAYFLFNMFYQYNDIIYFKFSFNLHTLNITSLNIFFKIFRYMPNLQILSVTNEDNHVDFGQIPNSNNEKHEIVLEMIKMLNKTIVNCPNIKKLELQFNYGNNDQITSGITDLMVKLNHIHDLRLKLSCNKASSNVMKNLFNSISTFSKIKHLKLWIDIPINEDKDTKYLGECLGSLNFLSTFELTGIYFEKLRSSTVATKKKSAFLGYSCGGPREPDSIDVGFNKLVKVKELSIQFNGETFDSLLSRLKPIKFLETLQLQMNKFDWAQGSELADLLGYFPRLNMLSMYFYNSFLNKDAISKLYQGILKARSLRSLSLRFSERDIKSSIIEDFNKTLKWLPLLTKLELELIQPLESPISHELFNLTMQKISDLSKLSDLKLRLLLVAKYYSENLYSNQPYNCNTILNSISDNIQYFKELSTLWIEYSIDEFKSNTNITRINHNESSNAFMKSITTLKNTLKNLVIIFYNHDLNDSFLKELGNHIIKCTILKQIKISMLSNPNITMQGYSKLLTKLTFLSQLRELILDIGIDDASLLNYDKDTLINRLYYLDMIDYLEIGFHDIWIDNIIHELKSVIKPKVQLKIITYNKIKCNDYGDIIQSALKY